jgi:hypothetical protein
MRKAFWPLVVVMGVLLAFGAINGGTFQPDLAEADISSDGEDFGVWWFFEVGDFDADEDADEDEDDDTFQQCNDDGQLVSRLDPFGDDGDLNDEDVIILAVQGDNSVWICVELDGNTDDDLEFDANDYGTWEAVLCKAHADPNEFEEEEDDCDDQTGLGTDRVVIQCDDFADCTADSSFGDVAALFECEEDKAGEAEITISQDNSVSFRIICFNEADALDEEITCVPCTVEIVPALGSTQFALVYVKLLDEDDNASRFGAEVTWTTDNCEISDDDIFEEVLLDEGADDEDLDTFDEIIDIFEEYEDSPTPDNADDLADFVDDVFDTDWDDEFEGETFIEEPWDLDDPFEDMDTFAAVVLNCGQGHDSSPGVAEVCAIIEVFDDPDIVECVDVTVVGGPATIAVAADQTSVRCGERVQITVTLKDSKGANVSDHTLVEAITNFGGVLGGTGAVAGQQGLVVPISSTLAETIKGVATFYLLTSDTHVGPYEVLVTAGGGGAVAGSFDDENGDDEDNDEDEGDADEDEANRDEDDEDFDFDDDDEDSQKLGGLFSTGVLNGRVQVACTIPAPAAPAAPAPAPTIRAPSTGQGAFITPPSTGDAGLADASGSSWVLFVIGGMAAFAIAGAVSFKLARR